MWKYDVVYKTGSTQRIALWKEPRPQLTPQICIKYSRFINCQSNASKGRGHDRLPNWNPKNGGMLISQPISRYLTNHSELCMSRLLNYQLRRISIYRLQRRPSFGFESSVSLTPLTSGDRVVNMYIKFREVWTCRLWDMWTDRQTDRHAHRNTSHPYRGLSNKQPLQIIHYKPLWWSR